MTGLRREVLLIFLRPPVLGLLSYQLTLLPHRPPIVLPTLVGGSSQFSPVI
jgi:hypothetical protein